MTSDVDWISGGYFIGLRTPRKAHMAAEWVPETVLSGSDCCTPRAPGAWAIEWVIEDDAAREAMAARFGLDAAGLARLMAWATAAVETGALGWPDVFSELAIAQRVKREHLAGCADAVVFGIALPTRLRQTFLADDSLGAGTEPAGVYRCVEAGLAPAAGGVVLGYEILGWDVSGFHAALCNGLERDYAEKLGVTLGPHGMPMCLADAQRCADYTNLDDTGAEPVLWLPWRLTLYAA